jgi:hypothetical protein
MDRKEKINAYKQSNRPMGIYQVRNTSSGKILIGSSKDLNGMLNRIRFQLKSNMHPNRELQNDFTREGETGFTFEILDQLEYRNEPDADYSRELQTLEAMWLEKLRPYHENGYNK